MTDVLGLLSAATALDRVPPGDANEDYSHDESLSAVPRAAMAGR
jgi:hypothetical protein